MRDLYTRLEAVGLDATFVRECVLPEWWADDLVKEPGMRTSVELILARHLGVPPSMLSDPDQPLALPGRAPSRYGATHRPDHNPHEALTRVVSRAAELAVQSSRANPLKLPDQPDDIRAEILNRGHPWVGLREIVDWCWSHGVLVLHLAHRPVGAGDVDGMALWAGGRPVIVVANPDEDPAWLLFIVAHELGRILLGHVSGPDSLVVDEALVAHDARNQESEAHRFATQLLDPRDIGVHFSPPWPEAPAAAAEEASQVGAEARVDPGYLLMQYGWRTRKYSVAQAALDLLRATDTAPEIIRSAAARRLTSGELCADDQDFLFAVTRIEPMAD